jgi:broad specificity phosphatase PhoE
MNDPGQIAQQSGGQPAPSRILLIRHGETDLNQEQRIRGWADVDLSDRGIQDTQKTAQHLQNEGISEIVTSDLSRSEQTGHILQSNLFVPTDSDRNLRPWDLGKFTGLKLDDIRSEMNRYVESPQKKVPGGESFNDFQNRWTTGLQTLAARAMQSETGTIAAVTHSRNIELTRAMLAGHKDTKTLVSANTVPPSGVMHLAIQNGSIHEEPFDNSHLQQRKDE